MPLSPYGDDSEEDTVFVPYAGAAPRTGEYDSLADSHVDQMIGSVLDGKFQILKRLGSGGMAVVYKAIQLSIGREVAVKTMQMSLSTDPILVQRFQREMASLGKLNHPNIVTVFASGQSDIGQLYMVMDFLSGPTLQAVLEQEKCIPIERAQHLFLQICDALNHAHKRDVVHRDLKPGNVILEKDERGNEVVKILDFGLAKIGESAERLTKAGEIWGSALYMSPEQCSGQDVDARTDIYSLGIIMYQTLTGTVPFRGKTFMETVGKYVNEKPQKMSAIRPDLLLPDMVEHVIMRCLEKDPDQRYESVADLKSSLMAVLPAHSITSRERPYNFSDRPQSDRKDSGAFKAPEPRRTESNLASSGKAAAKTQAGLTRPGPAKAGSQQKSSTMIGLFVLIVVFVLSAGMYFIVEALKSPRAVQSPPAQSSPPKAQSPPAQSSPAKAQPPQAGVQPQKRESAAQGDIARPPSQKTAIPTATVKRRPSLPIRRTQAARKNAAAGDGTEETSVKKRFKAIIKDDRYYLRKFDNR